MPTLMNSSRLETPMMAGRAMRPFSGKLISGRTPPRLPKKMKTNRVVRYGRKRSPSGPMFSSTIWLRMKSTSDSMTFCSPAGTSLGVRKASQNSSQTRPATRNVCSTTRLMPRLTPNSSRSTRLGHSNSSMPGAWNPSRASPIMDAVILAAPSAAAVPLDDQVERARRPDEDADRDQEAGAQPPVQQPADPAPGEDPCDQRAEDRPDDVAAAAARAARSFASTHGRANLSPRPRLLLVRLHVGD